MKDEAKFQTSVHVENVEKVFIKKVKKLGNGGYVSVHKDYIGKDVVVIITNGNKVKAKKVLRT